MADAGCYPDFTFPPKSDRIGPKSIKVTTGSPLRTTAQNRAFKSNGAAPRRSDIRKGTSR